MHLQCSPSAANFLCMLLILASCGVLCCSYFERAWMNPPLSWWGRACLSTLECPMHENVLCVLSPLYFNHDSCPTVNFFWHFGYIFDMIINTIYILQGLFNMKYCRVLRPWRLIDRVTHLSNLIVPTICPPPTLSHESFATDTVSEGNLL